jgi:type III restriction enzyme
MATGSGKTTVMAMIITWQVLNALTYPKSPRRYSSAIFLVAPGLTVKERLQVLMPGHEDNYYDSLSCAPPRRCASKS